MRVTLTLGTALMWGAASCCPSPTGDVLVVNNTERPVVFSFADASESTEVLSGRLGMLSSEPGIRTLVATADGKELSRRELKTSIEAVTVAVADRSQCVAIVEYTRQFSDEAGPIDLLAMVAPESSAAASKFSPTLPHAQLSQIFGPHDEVPTETYPNAIVRRATPVRCELLDDEEVLVNTLARLP